MYDSLTLEQKLDRAVKRGHPESKEAKKLRQQIKAQQEAAQKKKSKDDSTANKQKK